jgi:hypothetical protein
MLRKYNYNLKTGTVGTDDDNIATMLYTINQMEMYENYTTTNMEALDEKLGLYFFNISHIKVHLNRLLKISGEKINPETLSIVTKALDDALDHIRTYLDDDTPTTPDMSTMFPVVYAMLLKVVPAILALDAQAVGRV